MNLHLNKTKTRLEYHRIIRPNQILKKLNDEKN